MAGGRVASDAPGALRAPDWAALILRSVPGGTFLANGVQRRVAFGWSGRVPDFRARGIEFVLVLAAVGVALVFLGPGRWALESRVPEGSFELWLTRS